MSYTIEALSAAPYSEEKNKLRAVEEQLLTKRAELSKFETEYREASSFEFSCCCVEFCFVSVIHLDSFVGIGTVH